MKTAIYIEAGLTQLVLTPENDFEKGVISQVEKREQEVSIYTGGFYKNQAGYIRQAVHNDDQDSLIIIMELKQMSRQLKHWWIKNN